MPSSFDWSKFDTRSDDTSTSSFDWSAWDAPSKVEEEDKPDSWWDALGFGTQTTLQNVGNTIDVVQGDAAEILDNEKVGSTKSQDEFRQALAANMAEGDDGIWEGIGNVFDAAWDHPAGAFHEMVGQMPNMGVTLGSMWAGAKVGGAGGLAVAGPAGGAIGAIAGGITGMFLGNASIEIGAEASSKASDGQLTDIEMSDAFRQGSVKAGVITAVDTATMGLNKWILGAPGRAVESAVTKTLVDNGIDIGSKSAVLSALSDASLRSTVMSASKEAFEQATRLPARVVQGGSAFALETLSEGVGEYVGSAAAGLEASFTEAALESIMAMPMSVSEMYVSKNLNNPGINTGLLRQSVIDAKRGVQRQGGDSLSQAAAGASALNEGIGGVRNRFDFSEQDTPDTIDVANSPLNDSLPTLEEAQARRNNSPVFEQAQGLRRAGREAEAIVLEMADRNYQQYESLIQREDFAQNIELQAQAERIKKRADKAVERVNSKLAKENEPTLAPVEAPVYQSPALTREEEIDAAYAARDAQNEVAPIDPMAYEMDRNTTGLGYLQKRIQGKTDSLQAKLTQQTQPINNPFGALGKMVDDLRVEREQLEDYDSIASLEPTRYEDLPTPTVDGLNKANIPVDLMDEGVRQSLYRSAYSDLEVGGGITLLTDENDKIVGRTQSTNPDWFQSNEDMASVKYVRDTVEKALNGGKLGDKQRRVIEALIEINQDPDIANQADGVPAYDIADSKVFFDSKGRFQYRPDVATEGQTLAQLQETAEQAGVDIKAIRDLWNQRLTLPQHAEKLYEYTQASQQRRSAERAAENSQSQGDARQDDNGQTASDLAGQESERLDPNLSPEDIIYGAMETDRDSVGRLYLQLRAERPDQKAAIDAAFADAAPFLEDSEDRTTRNRARMFMRRIRGDNVKETLNAREDVAGTVLMNDAGDMGVMLSPDASEPGRFRMTSFSENGFTGHITRDSYAELIDEAVQDGYRQEDAEALNRLSELDSFKKGNEYAALIQKVNNGQMTHQAMLDQLKAKEQGDVNQVEISEERINALTKNNVEVAPYDPRTVRVDFSALEFTARRAAPDIEIDRESTVERIKQKYGGRVYYNPDLGNLTIDKSDDFDQVRRDIALAAMGQSLVNDESSAGGVATASQTESATSSTPAPKATQTIMSSSGKPFSTEATARASKAFRENPFATVESADDVGFVVRIPDEAAAKANAFESARKAYQRREDATMADSASFMETINQAEQQWQSMSMTEREAMVRDEIGLTQDAREIQKLTKLPSLALMDNNQIATVFDAIKRGDFELTQEQDGTVTPSVTPDDKAQIDREAELFTLGQNADSNVSIGASNDPTQSGRNQGDMFASTRGETTKLESLREKLTQHGRILERRTQNATLAEGLAEEVMELDASWEKMTPESRKAYIYDTLGNLTPRQMDVIAARPSLSDIEPGQFATFYQAAQRVDIKDYVTYERRFDATEAALAKTEETGVDHRIEWDEAINAYRVVEGNTDDVGTAPEHTEQGTSEEETQRIAELMDAKDAYQDPNGFNTRVFKAPEKNEIVRLNDKVKQYVSGKGWMSPSEAKKVIEGWEQNAAKQGEQNRSENGRRVVLSLFDLTGNWAKPWADAGYDVYTFDIQSDALYGDIMNFDVQMFADDFGGFNGNEVYAILAACPCTDFASSGSRHFAAKDKDGRTIQSMELVKMTMATVEYFKPAVWAIENPVGRIEKLGQLPPWRLSFDPFHFGEDYTKKTLLWGRFNGDLPIAPTDPVEGSKMHKKYGGKSMATKNARSATPMGFAYAFFDANNAVDHPVMAAQNRWDMMNPDVVKMAVDQGMTEDNIADVVEDAYFMDLDYDLANELLLVELRDSYDVDITGISKDLGISEPRMAYTREQRYNRRNNEGQINERKRQGVSRQRSSRATAEDGLQGDLFDAAAVSDIDLKPREIKDTFDLAYTQRTVGEYAVGFDVIDSPAKAAHVLAPIRKNAQENFLVLMLDKDNKPISILRHSIGMIDSASVSPLTVAGAIANTEGVASVYLSHNHPSGSLQESRADQLTTKQINDSLEGLGVRNAGHIIFGYDGKANLLDELGNNIDSIRAIPAPRRSKVNLVERRVQRRAGMSDLKGFTSPQDAMDRIANMPGESKIILLNTQHQPTGVLQMSPEEMMTLRQGGAKRIVQALGKVNAKAIMIHTNDKSAATNLSRYINSSLPEIKILDHFYEENGKIASDAERGGYQINEKGPWFSRRPDAKPAKNELGLYSSLEVAANNMNIPAWRQDKPANGREVWAKLSKEPGVKKEELIWSGVEEALTLDPKRKFSRDEVIQIVRNGVVKFDEYVAADAELPSVTFEKREYDDSELMAQLRSMMIEDVYIPRKGTTRESELSASKAEADRRLSEYEIHVAPIDDEINYVLYGNDDEMWRLDEITADGAIGHGVYESFNEAKVNADYLFRRDYAEDGINLFNTPRWENHVAPGEYENYREFKLTLPEVEGDFYKRVHFDESNIVAFIRATDREMKITNEEMFFIEELQSDWHTAGRTKGYTKNPVPEEMIFDMDREQSYLYGVFRDKVDELLASKAWVDDGLIDQMDRVAEMRVTDAKDLQYVAENTFGFDESNLDVAKPLLEMWDSHPALQVVYDAFKEYKRAQNDLRNVSRAVPDAPFKGDAWLALGMKRALYLAAQEGKTAFGWVDNATLQERWSDSSNYEAQYDRKMPSLAKKLTGETPRHRNGYWSMSLSEELREKILGEGFPMFSSKQNSDTSVSPLKNLNAIIDRAAAKIAGGRDSIVVTPEFDQLPAKIRNHAKKQGSDGSDILGVFHEGKIHVVANNLRTEAEVEEVIYHEATHAGTEALFQDKGVKTALNRLYAAMGGRKGFEQTAKDLGIEANLRPYQEGLSRQKDGQPVFTEEYRNMVLVGEMLAFVGQKGSKGLKLKVQEVIGAIREFFRKMGLMKLAEYGATDIAALAKRAREFQGQASKANEPMFMVAWHGTPHKVGKFSTDHIGTGEGAQAYGWGLYFASKRQVAEYYRDTLSTPTLRLGNKPLGAVYTADIRDTFKAYYDGIVERQIEAYTDMFADEALALELDDAAAAEAVQDFMELTYQRLFDDRPNAELEERIFTAAMRLKTEFSDVPIEINQFHDDIENIVIDIDNILSSIGMADNMDTLEYVARDYLNPRQQALYEEYFEDQVNMDQPDANLYKVDIPGDDVMLDWDKPLSEQSDFVKKVLSGILSKDEMATDTGRSLYESISSGYFGKEYRSPKAASKFLESKGIKGIRYLDGNTRGKISSDTANDVRLKKWGDNSYELRVYHTDGSKYGDWESLTQNEIADIIGEENAATLVKQADQAGVFKQVFLKGEAKIKGLHNYVIFDDSAIKILEENGEPMFSRRDEYAQNFEQWAGTSEVTEGHELSDMKFVAGQPVVARMYHGSTHEFSVFKGGALGNKDGHFGALNYLTSSEYDAHQNYSDEGPDLTGRIERLSESLESDVESDPESFGYTAEDLESRGAYDLAKDVARSKLNGGSSNVKEVYVRFKNPFVVGQTKDNYIDLYDTEALMDEAMGSIANSYGISQREAWKQYEDEVYDEYYELMSQEENPVLAALSEVLDDYDMPYPELQSKILEASADGSISHYDINELIRNSDEIYEISDFYEISAGEVVAKVAQNLGFDAIVLQYAGTQFSSMDMEENTAHVHIFDEDNTSIKSVENRGTFDDSNPDIFFSRRPQSPLMPAEEKLVDKFIRKVQDRLLPLKRVQATIEGNRGPIAEEQDAYMAEELFYGKTGEDIRQFEEQLINPLIEAMKASDISKEELDLFLIARHARERNAAIAEKNEAMSDGGSGMTNAEADRILQAFREEGKFDALAGLSNRVYEMTQLSRDLLRQGGLQDDALTDSWESQYEYYVPLRGFAEGELEADGRRAAKVGRGFDIRGKESMKALGRRSMARSPLEYVIQDMTTKAIRYRKNEVLKTLLNLAEANPDENFWEVFSDDNPDTQRVERNGKVTEAPVNMASMPDKYLGIKRDGKSYYLKLQDRRLHEAMQGLGNERSVPVLSEAVRWLSMVNTSLNPEFVVSNAARDIQTAVFNMLSEESMEGGKIEGEKLTKQVVKDWPKALWAIRNVLRTDTEAAEYSEWMEEYQDFLNAGAQTGYFDSKSVDRIARDLEMKMIEASGGVKGSALKLKNTITGFVDGYNTAVENAVRLSAYVNAKRAGLSKAKAASLAKNLTVNFNRKGELGPLMNSFYMFFNAAVQGTAQFARSLAPIKRDASGNLAFDSKLNTAQKLAGGIVVGAFGLAALNRDMGGEDDDGVPYWDKVPQHVRERNLVVMKGGLGDKPGEYWQFPLPYGYNIFYNIGDTLEAAVNSGYDERRKALLPNMFLATMTSFSPLGAHAGEPEQSIPLTLIPTVLQPAAELGMNINFFGGPIYQENFPTGAERPDSAMSFRNTKEIYRATAKWLNEVTGGNEWAKGAIDVSPDSIEHIIEFALGGLYKTTTRSVEGVIDLTSDVQLDANDIPFYRKLQGSVSPYGDMTVFYDRAKETETAQKARKELRGEERREYLADDNNDEKVRLYRLGLNTKKKLKQLRERRDKIDNDETLTAKQRDEKLRLIEQQQKAAVRRFNQRWNERVAGD